MGCERGDRFLFVKALVFLGAALLGAGVFAREGEHVEFDFALGYGKTYKAYENRRYVNSYDYFTSDYFSSRLIGNFRGFFQDDLTFALSFVSNRENTIQNSVKKIAIPG